MVNSIGNIIKLVLNLEKLKMPISEQCQLLEILFLLKCRSKDIIEPRHDKTNIMGLQPVWMQTSLSASE
jgi:hypothetical protein